ncbi:tRNA uridine-5-carboxymethylaminomethyl(34) synthesis GTPase MnmE [Candidatus Desantisbacteria bacterium CG2_30_40_21]|uniref:tRNA modification GTPase MnmE n=3 Tax=unclassified Candidatus Desantisiibacteriota TaxID=3106372 RepID=A0A2M7P281_9BACT|nr:MAG: tRNA uridine-5-carboxymethylaminomethyl(34) synthesis GTPase MnmE [Candidatus Desantisbacteria bacterium CG2_30_40_21]PIY19710.1 MAG: tRNA uridine-5-carboxymethylaminomethyl(34) synthesis GTPase MnmE [Candidatus Desantisbacteria bacterium CG_4_10_14_3_um_filter_40_18]PJB30508.1 MAG: tRNA uridine-5-carboxymethylaminomethyl(34) synthesis GTPase MnmE [Candidatus Desantisbacteria bacterium CG_4_9_14_3_um_filter_40_11]
MFHDTITAISTPIGEGGIGIVRLSGQMSMDIISLIFQGKIDILTAKSHTIHYGKIVHPETLQIIDTVLVSIMRSPHTYTREDVVEINAHSGSIVLQGILELTILMGARLSQPGEFTRRAFLNGRIDLAQAEAVIDIIRAKTDASLKVALSQLDGRLSRDVNLLRTGLIDLLTHVEALLDFSEEELEEIDIARIIDGLGLVEKQLTTLINSSHQGKILREGVSCVIVGRPNVGKSSLLNTLLGEARAIVTHLPGTTRDIIEEIIDISGIPLRIVDTAGLRETIDIIEKEGVSRAWKAIEGADAILLVLDASCPLTHEDLLIIERLKEQSCIVVLNKCDMKNEIDMVQLKRLFPDKPMVHISAINGQGMEGLRDAIKGLLLNGQINIGEGVMVSNVRHIDALKKALSAILRAKDTFKNNLSIDIIAVDLHDALLCLNILVGEITTEDILDAVFSRFCVGK